MIEHDPGGKGRMPLLPGYTGNAFFAGDNHEHRIWLTRIPKNRPVAAFEYALWIGINPSTASASEDDMTIRKDMGFSRRLGFTAYMKMNVASYRATYQTSLYNPSITINHHNNHPSILHFAPLCSIVVVATGNMHPRLQVLALGLFGALRDQGTKLKCLGLTNEGWPRHSSRIAYATEFEDYEPIR